MEPTFIKTNLINPERKFMLNWFNSLETKDRYSDNYLDYKSNIPGLVGGLLKAYDYLNSSSEKDLNNRLLKLNTAKFIIHPDGLQYPENNKYSFIDNSLYTTLGYYLPSNHTIHLNGKKVDGGTVSHELTHSINPEVQMATIRKIMNQTNELSSYADSEAAYLMDPNEIYARMMLFRYLTGLKPGQVVTKKFLNNNRLILDPYIQDFSDETLLRLFNEVADNSYNNNSNKFDYLYAKKGIKLIPRKSRKL